MPNLKIFVEEAVWTKEVDGLEALLPALRDILCRELEVDASICQFAIIPFRGMNDQAQISVEIQLLQKVERTRDLILSVCNMLRAAITGISQHRVAIRVLNLDPVASISLR
ncbi:MULTISPECIES: hypothetical protein [Mesorhizobium]|uniref:Uncharacterized protein n=2 Tax=Mesorhizobium TaxID=68287 RepID=G6YFY6_9HYPH|nr:MULTISPECIES: hypothetical protein [Mesorhizobium]ANT54338.1 hypothetical protein A6B35_30255 [Mesorhizobium amorphae CCNWGS0123]EHH09340.1 hypothetical protein MEA186_24462 [Mesorhizobium amorphae CCNWGS0123]MCV3241976.1 hypothetical protein [Mesorhizobium sp. ZC-5]